MLTSTAIHQKRAQRGITLIEVSIGLIIAAIVAAAAFVAFQNNSRRNELRDNVREVTEAISESISKVGRPVGYVGYTEQIALASGTLNSATNSYGGTIDIAPGSGTPPTTAILTWPDVEPDQCVDLLVATNQLAPIVKVGTNVVKDELATPPVAFTLAKADEFCVDTKASNDINYEFGRR